MTCRTCDHAYLRTERTKDWNYECCGLGANHGGFVPFLEGCCDLYRPMSEERAATIIHRRPAIIFGEPIEL
jgi:hypothetical protein